MYQFNTHQFSDGLHVEMHNHYYSMIMVGVIITHLTSIIHLAAAVAQVRTPEVELLRPLKILVLSPSGCDSVRYVLYSSADCTYIRTVADE